MKSILKWMSLMMVASLMKGPIAFAQTSLVEKNSFANMSSTQIEKLVDALVAKHPETLTKENIGTSADGRNIYAVQLHLANEETAALKYHGLVEAGTHAKETVNPYITIKMIEQYANDLENDKVLPSYNTASLLENGAIHFVPLSNPDGYDLVKFGPSVIRSQSIRENLLKFGKGSYTQFKASATGVDLNRNYALDYFNVAKGEWAKVPRRVGGSQYASSPSRAYYGGPYPGSEPETQALMAYIQHYDFKYLISYHSRGNLIYYDRPYLGMADYNKKALKYARIAADLTSYKILNYGQSLNYNGYLGDYFANQTLSPAVTLETTVSSLPSKPTVFDSTFSRVWDVPLRFMQEAKKETANPYWVYLKHQGKKSFSNMTYALAYAEKYSGQFALETPNIETQQRLEALNLHDGSTFYYLSRELVEEMKLSGSISKAVPLSKLMAYESGQQWKTSNCILKQDWTAGEVDDTSGQAYRASLHFSNRDELDQIQSGRVDMTAYVKWVNRKPIVTSVEYILTLNPQ